jgi:hypothetical protein
MYTLRERKKERREERVLHFELKIMIIMVSFQNGQAGVVYSSRFVSRNVVEYLTIQ